MHPDIVASKGADAKQLFQQRQDPVHAGRHRACGSGMQAEQPKVTPGFNMQPVPLFSATGGDPLLWGDERPIFYTFIKKGLGKERVEELLRVLNWCAAPFGTKEFELREYGVEGKHFTRDCRRRPVDDRSRPKEIAEPVRLHRRPLPAVVQHSRRRRTTSRTCSRTPTRR